MQIRGFRSRTNFLRCTLVSFSSCLCYCWCYCCCSSFLLLLFLFSSLSFFSLSLSVSASCHHSILSLSRYLSLFLCFSILTLLPFSSSFISWVLFTRTLISSVDSSLTRKFFNFYVCQSSLSLFWLNICCILALVSFQASWVFFMSPFCLLAFSPKEMEKVDSDHFVRNIFFCFQNRSRKTFIFKKSVPSFEFRLHFFSFLSNRCISSVFLPQVERRILKLRAVVVAQLVERSLLTPEIRRSNPSIGKVLSTNCN